MRKILFFFTLLLSLSLCSCDKTPQQYADENIRLHIQLTNATNRADSDSIFHQIAVLESEARAQLTKTEFKDYARLAHPQK